MTVERDEGFRAGVEAAAAVVDQCNREGPYNAIGAASRIRALLPDNAGQPDGGVEAVVAALQARYDQIEQQWRDEPIAAIANQKIATGRCLQIAKRIAASAPAATTDHKGSI